MTGDRIILSRAGLRLELARPGAFYQGTRFDRSGVFLGIRLGDRIYCDEWNDSPDPMAHDRVNGPSEEFYGCLGYDAGPVPGRFLKVGVGILERDGAAPYDWFHRYRILDPGRWEVEQESGNVRFVHTMPGIYEYSKTVGIAGEASFRISHRLVWDGSGAWMPQGAERFLLRQYCHNFFTFGLPSVGPERSVEFDAPVSGAWRPDSVNCRSDARRVWIDSGMEPGQKCYLGDIRYGSDSGYGLTLRAGGRAVRIDCTLPMGRSVLWSNHRVFCPEPYVDLYVEPETPLEWSIDYKLL